MLGHKPRDLKQHLAVSLEALVPQGNFYRQIDQCIDLSFVRDFAAEFYSSFGRPSIDPVVFFRLELIVVKPLGFEQIDCGIRYFLGGGQQLIGVNCPVDLDRGGKMGKGMRFHVSVLPCIEGNDGDVLHSVIPRAPQPWIPTSAPASSPV